LCVPDVQVKRHEAERALLVAVGPERGRGEHWSLDDSVSELEQLTRTAQARPVGRVIQHAEQPHPVTYVGKGKLDEVSSTAARDDVDVVIFDDELSPTQQRNLERALDRKVIDRTALILDIFAARAQTHEGRLQVALAQNEYLLPRLTGQWSHLERLGAGIGTRGPGETQLETDRRLVRRKISRLKAELDDVRQHRQRLRDRRRLTGLPICALVGYTNAGKSTLMRAIAGADVLAEDKLFATLDPTMRQVRLPGGGQILLSDTVGFIHKLPTLLVAAFRATLEELDEADVLLHVVDLAHANRIDQSLTVESILRELGLGDRPRVLVLNKVDLLDAQLRPSAPAVAHALREIRVAEGSEVPRVLVSGVLGAGLDDLLLAIEGTLAAQRRPIDVLIPYDRGDLLHRLHEFGAVDQEEHLAEGVRIRGRAPVAVAGLVRAFAYRRPLSRAG
jgi:GTP-binding protein HflX